MVVLSEVDRAAREAACHAPPVAPPPVSELPAAELPTRAAEDEDYAWGGGSDSNDRRLQEDVPPHWGGRAGS